MKTVIGIMFFINDLFFVGYLEEDDYKTSNRVRSVLEDEFRDLDSNKLVSVLCILDDIRNSFIDRKIDDVSIQVELLSNFFCIKLKKHNRFLITKMVVKIKEYFEKRRHVKNNDKSKKTFYVDKEM